jgi:hypothetical protein
MRQLEKAVFMTKDLIIGKTNFNFSHKIPS